MFLEIEKARIQFSDTQIPEKNSLSFQVQTPQEKIAWIGYSGIGKTTFLRAIHLDLPLSSGILRCQGKSIVDFSSQEKKIWRKSVPLLHATRMHIPTPPVRVDQWMQRQKKILSLDWSPLSSYPLLEETYGKIASRWLGELSHFESKILHMAQAILQKPTFLLYDEPFLDLTPSEERELWDIIDSIHQSSIGYIMVTQRTQSIQKRVDSIYRFDLNGLVRQELPL